MSPAPPGRPPRDDGEPVAGAVPTQRVPGDGPAVFEGLGTGNSDLGLADDVDAALPRVTGLGGQTQGPPTDVPRGQRVAYVGTPTATR